MYFRLNPECYFVCGEKLGAIYDLVDNKVYSLNQRETEILKQCEKNSSVNTEEDFLKELKQLRMGNFYTDKIYVQKLRIGSMFQDPFSEPLQIQRAFIEINNSCNRNCWYCGFQGSRDVWDALAVIVDRNWRHLSIERWKEIFISA
jgi:tRNA A37 methylthiotransferase MiaB